ncbi:MAG: hypothetical protein ABWZ57_13725 [Mesorhizobium sp.]
MIRSLKVVLCRTVVRHLQSRYRIDQIAQDTRIPVMELRRLMEFGSPLGADDSARLIRFGRAFSTRPKAPSPVQRAHAERPVSLAPVWTATRDAERIPARTSA